MRDMSKRRIFGGITAPGNLAYVRRVGLFPVGKKPLGKCRVVVALSDARHAVHRVRIAAVETQRALAVRVVLAFGKPHGSGVYEK